jgi:hypothetical protein
MAIAYFASMDLLDMFKCKGHALLVFLPLFPHTKKNKIFCNLFYATKN